MNLFHRHKDFDLIAIGDITTDAFIRLKDAKTVCNAEGKIFGKFEKTGKKVETRVK